MATTVAQPDRDDAPVQSGLEGRVARLHVVRPERPREGDEGRRFLIVAGASRKLANAASVSEMMGVVRAALVPSLADRCVIHAGSRRGSRETPGGARALRPDSLPHGHPLRECADSQQSLLFSTTSSAMIRVLDPSGKPGQTSMQGCVHVLMAPLKLRERPAVVTLLRGFGRGRFNADDLLVVELVLSRMETMLGRAATRFRG